MAPSHKRVLIILLVALAATVQPSAAIRIPPLIPCIPGLPKIPFIPCYEMKPLQFPKECSSHLAKMTPCAGFFTNSSVSSPPGACCDGYHYVLDKAGACFCHYSNGDIGKLIPGTLNFTRMFALPEDCGSHVRLEAFTDCTGVIDLPPMTLPSPPPSLPPAA